MGGGSAISGGSVRVGGPGGALRPHRIPVLALREDRSGRRTGRIRRFPHDSAVPTKRPTSAERNDPPAAPFLASAPAPLLPDAWNAGPMRCVRHTGCDLGRPRPVKRAESPDAGPKRWPPRIFHPPSQARPVPKWRNDAIPRERKNCRAPESHAPATFSPPRATRHRPARARGGPRTTSGCSLRLFPSATLLRPPLRFFFPYSEGSSGVAEGKRRSRRPRTGTGDDRSRARTGAGLAARAEGVTAPADRLRAQRRPAAPAGQARAPVHGEPAGEEAGRALDVDVEGIRRHARGRGYHHPPVFGKVIFEVGSTAH